MKTRVLILSICLGLAATAALAHGGEEHVMGTVAKVTDKSITVKTTAKEPVTVAIMPTTKFISGKASAKVADLHVGDRVVIHAVEGTDKKVVADTVEFTPAKKPTQAAAAQKKPV